MLNLILASRANESQHAKLQAIETALGPDTEIFNEYHALIVHHAKEVCLTHPRCDACYLSAECNYFNY